MRDRALQDGDTDEYPTLVADVQNATIIEEYARKEAADRQAWFGYFEPASRLKFSLELLTVTLATVLVLMIVFLLSVGGYTLVQVAP